MSHWIEQVPEKVHIYLEPVNVTSFVNRVFTDVIVRYCQIKTTPRVEMKGLLVQTEGLSLLLGSE
jgi:hypothetical protein